MYHDSVLHALTNARLDDLLGDAAQARDVRIARGRPISARRASALLRRLGASRGRGLALPPAARPAEQTL